MFRDCASLFQTHGFSGLSSTSDRRAEVPLLQNIVEARLYNVSGINQLFPFNDRAIGSGHFVTTDFNPWLICPMLYRSAVGTMHLDPFYDITTQAIKF